MKRNKRGIRKDSRSAATVSTALPDGNNALYLAGAGLLLVLYGFTGLDSMTHWLPSPLPFQAPWVFPFVALGSFLLLLSFRRLPELPAASMGPWTTRILLGLILYAGFHLRIHPFDLPNPRWNDDSVFTLISALTAVDFPDQRPLIFEYGATQPFLPYLTALVYALIPDLPSLHLQKIVWGLVDVAGIGVGYFLGKELGGRRAGLILAAALAFSKPVIANCVGASVPVTTPLAMGLLLLFTFRFFRQPGRSRALVWGAALAFGAYCYHANRPFLWWIPVAVTAGFLFRPGTMPTRRAVLFVSGTFVVWTLGAMRVGLFPSPAWFSHPAFLIVLGSGAAALILGGWIIRPEGDHGMPHYPYRSLILGLLSAGVLMSPMLLHPLYSSHQDVASVFNPHNAFYPPGGLTLSFWWGKFVSMFAGFFLPFGDLEEMSMPFEAFWSILSMPLILSGVAWALVRRDRTSLFLVGCAAVGMLPHFFTFGSHTGRLMGVVIPLVLLGVIAWEAWLRALDARGRAGRLAGSLLLLLWGAGSFYLMDHRFRVVPYEWSNSITTMLRALREDLPNRRILLAPFEYPSTWILNPLVDDRGDVLLFDPAGNGIPIHADGRVIDAVLYFPGNDRALRDRLKREFPRGHLKETREKGQAPTEAPVLYRFYLDGKDVPRDPKTLFHTIDLSTGLWSRRYYAHRFGMGHGIVEHVEWVKDPASPASPRARGEQSAVARGTLQVGKEGIHVFSATGANDAVLRIDGKRILDHRPAPGEELRTTGRLFLKAGDHPVLLRTYFRSGTVWPGITVEGPGGEAERAMR